MSTLIGQLVRRFYAEVWNQRSEAAAREILHPDFRFRGSLDALRTGPEGFIDYMHKVHDALGDYTCDLVELGGKPFKLEAENTSTSDLAPAAQKAAEAAGLIDVTLTREADADGRGRGKHLVRISGRPDPEARYTVESIDVTRTRSRPFPMNRS